MLNIAGQKLKTLPPINVFNRLILNKYFFSIFFFFLFLTKEEIPVLRHCLFKLYSHNLKLHTCIHFTEMKSF